MALSSAEAEKWHLVYVRRKFAGYARCLRTWDTSKWEQLKAGRTTQERSHWQAMSDKTRVQRTNDIRHHFSRGNVVDDTLSVKYIKTEDLVADMLPKALGSKRIKFLCEASAVNFANRSHAVNGSVDKVHHMYVFYGCMFIGYW